MRDAQLVHAATDRRPGLLEVALQVSHVDRFAVEDQLSLPTDGGATAR
jgi:hypothetical protein